MARATILVVSAAETTLHAGDVIIFQTLDSSTISVVFVVETTKAALVVMV
jgi:hypothetical protein